MTLPGRLDQDAALLGQGIEHPTLDLTAHVHQIISKIEAASHKIEKTSFSHILFPFLRCSVKAALQDNNGTYCNLFRTTIHVYIDRFVGVEPQQPQDWSKRCRGCDCGNCIILDNFLEDPHRKQIRFEKPG